MNMVAYFYKHILQKYDYDEFNSRNYRKRILNKA